MNQIVTKREDWKPILLEESVDLIRQFDSPIAATVLSDGHTAYVPLDIDVSPFDNSNIWYQLMPKIFTLTMGSVIIKMREITEVKRKESKLEVQDLYRQVNIRNLERFCDH